MGRLVAVDRSDRKRAGLDDVDAGEARD